MSVGSSALKTILFSDAQSCIRIRSFRSSKRHSIIILVSSANMRTCEFVQHSGKLFMKTMNKRGPKVEPRETPLEIISIFEEQSLTIIRCLRLWTLEVRTQQLQQDTTNAESS